MASKTETLELADPTVTVRLRQQCKERAVDKDGETTLLHCYRLCEWNPIIDANTHHPMNVWQHLPNCQLAAHKVDKVTLFA